jgi:outer membrane protein
MSRPLTLLVVLWNLVLTILIGFLLFRESPTSPPVLAESQPVADIGEESFREPIPTGDTLAVPEARIAYFSMDSVQERYTLVKESAERVRAETRKLESELSREVQRAQGRAQELASKDHTYSTQAQLMADQEEYQNLERKIQEMRMRSQDKLEDLQVRMLTDISKEVEGFLTEYNETAGFDYIFSIQDGGQIWVGNPQLDITTSVVNGLNARERARKLANK